MFTHILAPLDGSRLAEAAIPAVQFLSSRFQARITLLHMIEKNAPHRIHGQPHLNDAGAATLYLNDISTRYFSEMSSVSRHVHTTEVDNVAESITAHANELACDLIVMCSHGRGRALHLMLGSIAQKVIGLDIIPTLLIRPDDNDPFPVFLCRHLLVPLDGIPDHEQAIPAAVTLATTCSATIHLAMVIPRFTTLSGPMTVPSRFLPGTTSRMLEISAQNASAYLRGQAESLQRHGVDVITCIRRGDPASIIGGLAEQTQSDIIILATHGKSGMEAFWAGSVAHRVCSQYRIPILLIPIKQAGGIEENSAPDTLAS